ncbi:MAG: sugar ABC transporter substrate-binding protein [Armatimonadota bacterium]|nr:sugar ABC transporter substrate-binding protein [Armatimonadota bacterium]MDR7451530.1 sugar ABC transporter substrate-binding protein [Armatimonadota bacterium]MDR7467497.1 sugar ABC transporter substrate-binding protein [Armatimonadota bacterium]MDR7494371.1 sugar ABC transporter substrate-binding protein [Armatimonadota bacterium]MDR7499188.1 sugar ABC transporter substrate-binding protein [Armatimonadota bacterium]
MGTSGLTRREFVRGAALTGMGLWAGTYARSFVPTPTKAEAAAAADERRKLARQYQNAKPGERFTIGHITWGLAQEYLMMCYQASEQACRQLGLKFAGAVAESDAAWIQTTESMIAAGAKAIIYNCPSAAIMPALTKICNERNVFMATHFGYTGDIFPGDLGPRWVVDNTPLSDEQTFLPLMLLFEKMRRNGKRKLLHHQAHKTVATCSTVYINLGVFQAWQFYPEMQVLGHQYGEWNYEGGRKAAEASLAIRTDYEALWGANDSQTMGALKACEDRGLKLGPYTASRDMEMTTAEAILKGNFLVTAGFAIPYFGGRMVPMLYDMCVGAWYPLKDEMVQAGRIDCYGRPGEIEELARGARLIYHPNFKLGPTAENLEKILKQMKAKTPNYPYDFRRLSLSKCQELGLAYDRHAGGGTHLGQHDYYFPAKLRKFGSIQALKKHVAALHKHFLDFRWADTWEQAQEYAKGFPPELKTEPVWV